MRNRYGTLCVDSNLHSFWGARNNYSRRNYVINILPLSIRNILFHGAINIYKWNTAVEGNKYEQNENVFPRNPGPAKGGQIFLYKKIKRVALIEFLISRYWTFEDYTQLLRAGRLPFRNAYKRVIILVNF